MAELTDLERAVLAFANRSFMHPGAKANAIDRDLGINWVRYHQILMALAERPEALEADPVLVNRLRRQKTTQRARRFPRAG